MTRPGDQSNNQSAPQRRAARLAREKLLFRYTGALERGDFETLAAILSMAESDPALARQIDALNQIYGQADSPDNARALLAARPVNGRYPSEIGMQTELRAKESEMYITQESPRAVGIARPRRGPLTAAAAVVAFVLIGVALFALMPDRPPQPVPGAAQAQATATATFIVTATVIPVTPTQVQEAVSPPTGPSDVYRYFVAPGLSQEQIQAVIADALHIKLTDLFGSELPLTITLSRPGQRTIVLEFVVEEGRAPLRPNVTPGAPPPTVPLPVVTATFTATPIQ